MGKRCSAATTTLTRHPWQGALWNPPVRIVNLTNDNNLGRPAGNRVLFGIRRFHMSTPLAIALCGRTHESSSLRGIR